MNGTAIATGGLDPRQQAYSVDQVAQMLGYGKPSACRRLLERLRAKGMMKVIRIGERKILIPRGEVERLLRGEVSE